MKLFEYRRQVGVGDVRAAFISRFDTAAHQADEARMELAACKSLLGKLPA